MSVTINGDTGIDKIQDGSIVTADFASTVPLGTKNLIINGAMQIAQRATSASGLTSSGYHTVDRWNNVGMSIGTWTISQSTEVPSGQGFAKSLKYDCTTAEASPSAGDQLHLSQRIEGQMLQHLKKGTSSAEKLTLSFWVRSNKTGTYQTNLRDKDNTRIIGKTYTIDAADTWEKKTLTFDGDTTGSFGNDNGNSLEVEWFLGAGSNYTGGSVPTAWEAETASDRAAGLSVNVGDSTSNDWYITGVQLEVGDTATPFEHRPYDMELARCQRYCAAFTVTAINTFFGSGFSYSSTNSFVFTPMPVPMRTSPTVTYSTTNQFGVYDGTASTIVLTNITAYSMSPNGIGTQTTVASGLTAGQGTMLKDNGNTSAKIICTSEL